MPIEIQNVPKRHALAPAKQRILDTADRLFYDEGIRAVGVDRLISESSVTKATFYKHYGSKDRLIVEYVLYRHLQSTEQITQLARELDDPADLLNELVHQQIAFIGSTGFRGCPFINAAIEFTEAGHPVRRAVHQHREWFHGLLESLLRETGHPMPGDAADDLMVARDGAMTGGYAGDSIAATSALQRAIDRVISHIEEPIAA